MLDLDIETFDQVTALIGKLEADRRVGSLYTAYVAAQGDKKSVTKFAESIRPTAKKAAKEIAKDAEANGSAFRSALNG